MPESLPVLFIQNGCAESAKARAWLHERSVAFRERNVTGDHTGAQELIATSIFATPLLVVGNARILGFRPERLAVALGFPTDLLSSEI